MDKKTMMEKLARDAFERGSFNGAWLYAEKGEIVSKGAFGWGIAKDEEHGLIVSHSGGMPGLETWFEHFVDEDRMLVILNCREFSDARAFVRCWDGMRAIARGGRCRTCCIH